MKNSLFIYFSLFLLFIASPNFAQESRIRYEVETQAITTTSGVMPFWMRSNQYGSIPLSGISSAFLGRAYKDYDTTIDGYLGKPKTFDWGAGFEGRVNVGKNSELILTEAYLKAHLGPFELKAGRAKETMGLTGDTALTSGSFAISGNALGIPKVQISIPEYYTLPLLNELFAVKGNFAHGWVGSQFINHTIGTNKYSLVNTADTYFHQKSLYGRFGKPSWKFKLYAGFNHQAFYGSEDKIYGENNSLTPFQNYLHVVTGKVYNVKNIGKSKVGNHLGSIDLGIEYEFTDMKIAVFRQQFYDVGALYYLANLRDGLSGLSITNLKKKGSDLSWKKIILEFLYTKNQGGELWSRSTPSGDENYYNHYVYKNGWSYKMDGIGTPFISNRNGLRIGLPSMPTEQFINNRVIAFQLGIDASIKKWEHLIKASYSLNYGTYGTSLIGHSDNTGAGKRKPLYGVFKKTKQLSLFLESIREFNNGLTISFVIASDMGQLLNNSNGLILKISKKW